MTGAAKGPGRSVGGTGPKGDQQQHDTTDAAGDQDVGPEPILVRMADVPPVLVRWLWRGFLPLGRLALLVGPPGLGKSYLVCCIAAIVSRWATWPDGSTCAAGDVLLVSCEDDPGDTIRPRLDAHGADTSRVTLLEGVRRRDADGKPYDAAFTLADLDPLRLALETMPDCRLVVIDPIGSYLGARVDAHRDNEIRAVLAPLAALAKERGVAILIVAHTRKAGSMTADDTALGSRAFVGLARCVWHLARDPEDETRERRLLLPGKNNLARAQTGLAFRIDGEPAAVTWEADPVSMHADDAMAAHARHATEQARGRRAKPGPAADERDAVAEWLRGALAAGPRSVRDVQGEARELMAYKKHTVERAKSDIGAVSFRLKIPGPWLWRLPIDDTAQGGAHLGDLGALAKNTGKTSDIDGQKTQGRQDSQVVPKPAQVSLFGVADDPYAGWDKEREKWTA